MPAISIEMIREIDKVFKKFLNIIFKRCFKNILFVCIFPYNICMCK